MLLTSVNQQAVVLEPHPLQVSRQPSLPSLRIFDLTNPDHVDELSQRLEQMLLDGSQRQPLCSTQTNQESEEFKSTTGQTLFIAKSEVDFELHMMLAI